LLSGRVGLLSFIIAWSLVRYGTQAVVNQERSHTSHGNAHTKQGMVQTSLQKLFGVKPTRLSVTQNSRPFTNQSSSVLKNLPLRFYMIIKNPLIGAPTHFVGRETNATGSNDYLVAVGDKQFQASAKHRLLQNSDALGTANPGYALEIVGQVQDKAIAVFPERVPILKMLESRPLRALYISLSIEMLGTVTKTERQFKLM